jgi:hypothetical protein
MPPTITHKFKCRYCGKGAPNSSRNKHTGSQKCRSQCLHVTSLYLDASSDLVSKKQKILTTVSNDLTKCVEEHYETVKKESTTWAKDVYPLITTITTKIFNIYEQTTRTNLEFGLDTIVGVELLIGEYIYTKLSSCHPNFAIHTMGILPMDNILNYLDTTLNYIRSHNQTRAAKIGSMNEVYSAIVDCINDVYDAMMKIPGTALLNSMIAYESARLNQFDDQKFESYHQDADSTSSGTELRISTNATFIRLFKQQMLIRYYIPNDIGIDLFVDVANPDIQHNTQEIFETSCIHAHILNEMTMFVINRLLAIFKHIAQVSSFRHGNILQYMYPRFSS